MTTGVIAPQVHETGAHLLFADSEILIFSYCVGVRSSTPGNGVLQQFYRLRLNLSCGFIQGNRNGLTGR